MILKGLSDQQVRGIVAGVASHFGFAFELSDTPEAARIHRTLKSETKPIPHDVQLEIVHGLLIHSGLALPIEEPESPSDAVSEPEPHEDEPTTVDWDKAPKDALTPTGGPVWYSAGYGWRNLVTGRDFPPGHFGEPVPDTSDLEMGA